jgi:hypothetical protein
MSVESWKSFFDVGTVIAAFLALVENRGLKSVGAPGLSVGAQKFPSLHWNSTSLAAIWIFDSQSRTKIV